MKMPLVTKIQSIGKHVIFDADVDRNDALDYIAETFVEFDDRLFTENFKDNHPKNHIGILLQFRTYAAVKKLYENCNRQPFTIVAMNRGDSLSYNKCDDLILLKNAMLSNEVCPKINEDHERYTYTARFNLKFESVRKLVASDENAIKMLSALIEVKNITESKYNRDWRHA